MNRKFQLLASALLIAGTLVFTSCSKDDGEDQIIIDVENLTSGTWTLSGVEASDETLAGLLEAFSPESFVFNADNTYSSVVIGLDDEGTWSFSDNELTLDAGTEFEETYEVRELSASRLVIYIEGEEEGVMMWATMTYAK